MKTMDAKTMLGVGIAAIGIGVLVFVLSLAELYSQLGRYKSYWDKQNAAAKTDGVVYVAFGDSAAQGVGATKPQNGYVGLVGKALSEKYQEPVQIINLSKSGAKVRDVLDTQLPKYEALKLKKEAIVTVEIGANDILSFDRETFENDANELMKHLPKNAVISDIPYFGKTRFGKYQPRAEEANSILWKAAAKHGRKLVPLHDKVKSNTGLSTLAADIFHPSDRAYRENWAPTFLAGIE